MAFDLPAAHAAVVFQLAPGGVEGVPECHVGVFMRMIVMLVVADDDFLVGNGKFDPHAVEIALMMVAVAGAYHHVAADDIGVHLFQFHHLLADIAFNRVGVR